MASSVRPLQKILFGSPGTGKSYKIRTIATEQLGIELDERTKTLSNTIKTVFHPEYTYADFMGKLLPHTQGGNVIYKFYPGHFLQALGNAYKSLMNGDESHHLLVIDELNRGNAAAIFGTVFQLLDRENDDWSSYEVDLSTLELIELLRIMEIATEINKNDEILVSKLSVKLLHDYFSEIEHKREEDSEISRLAGLLKRNKISLPPNLSILATINTSDESIYYLDSAFKRRWDWEYIASPRNTFYVPEVIQNSKVSFEYVNDDFKIDLRILGHWHDCVVGVNKFIIENSSSIKRIEDKQIGWWFIKSENDCIPLEVIRHKLMFYLWDSVFSKDRRPLESILSRRLKESDFKLITFADFIEHTEVLVKYFIEIGDPTDLGF